MSSTNVDMDVDTPVKKLELFEKTFGGLGEGEPKLSIGSLFFFDSFSTL